MPEASLIVDDVRLVLGGRRVLDGLTFHAAPGAVTALLGPNGAGKSTTIRCCTGLLTADAGRVSVLGQAPGSPGAAARIGLMPQSTGAWSGIRPGELLRYLARLYAHPHRPEQWTTVVAAPHRGHRLGLLLKAANLQGLAVDQPEARYVDTWNAGENDHMLAINTLVGFRPHSAHGAWQWKAPQA